METPTITTSCYNSTTTTGHDFGGQLVWGQQPQRVKEVFDRARLAQALHNETNETEPTMPSNLKRVVKVYVADPDEKVPADKSLLYEGKEHVTDLTDQELFFEVDIKPLLEKHNADRVKTVDKPASQKFGKEVYLEPAKIRDLRMTVVVVAQF